MLYRAAVAKTGGMFLVALLLASCSRDGLEPEPGVAVEDVLPSLELLQEIQVTGDIFFPTDWLQATLGPHHSPEVARVVRQFLAQRPGYNPQLRMKILQAADPLFRAADLRRRTIAAGTD